MTFNGHTIFEAKDGAWMVGVAMADGSIAITNSTRYASEATATLEAKRRHYEKPFMNFAVVRA